MVLSNPITTYVRVRKHHIIQTQIHVLKDNKDSQAWFNKEILQEILSCLKSVTLQKAHDLVHDSENKNSTDIGEAQTLSSVKIAYRFQSCTVHSKNLILDPATGLYKQLYLLPEKLVISACCKSIATPWKRNLKIAKSASSNERSIFYKTNVASRGISKYFQGTSKQNTEMEDKHKALQSIVTKSGPKLSNKTQPCKRPTARNLRTVLSSKRSNVVDPFVMKYMSDKSNSSSEKHVCFSRVAKKDDTEKLYVDEQSKETDITSDCFCDGMDGAHDEADVLLKKVEHAPYGKKRDNSSSSKVLETISQDTNVMAKKLLFNSNDEEDQKYKSKKRKGSEIKAEYTSDCFDRYDANNMKETYDFPETQPLTCKFGPSAQESFPICLESQLPDFQLTPHSNAVDGTEMSRSKHSKESVVPKNNNVQYKLSRNCKASPKRLESYPPKIFTCEEKYDFFVLGKSVQGEEKATKRRSFLPVKHIHAQNDVKNSLVLPNTESEITDGSNNNLYKQSRNLQKTLMLETKSSDCENEDLPVNHIKKNETVTHRGFLNNAGKKIQEVPDIKSSDCESEDLPVLYTRKNKSWPESSSDSELENVHLSRNATCQPNKDITTDDSQTSNSDWLDSEVSVGKRHMSTYTDSGAGSLDSCEMEVTQSSSTVDTSGFLLPDIKYVSSKHVRKGKKTNKQIQQNTMFLPVKHRHVNMSKKSEENKTAKIVLCTSVDKTCKNKGFVTTPSRHRHVKATSSYVNKPQTLVYDTEESDVECQLIDNTLKTCTGTQLNTDRYQAKQDFESRLTSSKSFKNKARNFIGDFVSPENTYDQQTSEANMLAETNLPGSSCDGGETGLQDVVDVIRKELLQVRNVKELNEEQLLYLLTRNMTYLKRIFHGQDDCERHTEYKKGGTAKNNLTYNVRLSVFSDDQIELIMHTLTTVFHHNYLDYILKVLLPECAIKIYMDIHGVSHDGAEEVMCNSGIL